MLKSILLHVQQQPKSVRNQYATAVAAVFTGFVAVIWLVTQSSALSNTTDSAAVATDAPQRTPFSTLVDQGKKQFAAAMAALQPVVSPTESTEAGGTVDAKTLILTEETITDVSAAAVTEVPAEAVPALIRIATSSEALPSASYREVQIVTTTESDSLPEITQ